MTIRVDVDARFTAALKMLPPDRARGAARALVKFQEAPQRAGLNFHALKNSRDCWIIYVNDKGDRIILRRVADDHYMALDVGPHENVYRRWNR